MRDRSISRITAVATLLWCPVFCQTPANPPAKPSKAETYEAFFKRVADLGDLAGKGPVKVVSIEGEAELILPKLQDVLGLTDREVEALNVIATRCVRRMGEITRPQSWVFAARMQQLAAGEMSPSQAQRMKSLQDLQEKTVLDHIQALKDEIGPEAFQVIESFVDAPLRNPKELMPSVRIPRE